jgi:hypothetical protein
VLRLLLVDPTLDVTFTGGKIGPNDHVTYLVSSPFW